MIRQLEFISPIWARGGHLQTIWGHLLRLGEKPIPGAEALVIPLPDGDELAAELHRGESGTVVYLFHGLASDTSAGYMIRSARLALSLGHSVMLVNHRGCGAAGRLLRHSQPYHSGRAEDLSAAIQYGRKLFPRHRHFAVGFSLSGNATLLLLAGQRGATPPDGGISINAPINLSGAARELSRGFNRLYDLRFIADLREDIARRQIKGWAPKEIQIPRLASCVEFDDLYTGPFGGFGTGPEYYRICSAAQYLPLIKVPTVLITSMDDPFVPSKDYLAATPSPTTEIWMASTGGHMGYIEERAGSIVPSGWLDQWLHRALDHVSGNRHSLFQEK